MTNSPRHPAKLTRPLGGGWGQGFGHDEMEGGSAKTVTGILPGNAANNTVPALGKDRVRNSPLRELRMHAAKIGIDGCIVKKTRAFEQHRAVTPVNLCS
jgi:hypothetical protein